MRTEFKSAACGREEREREREEGQRDRESEEKTCHTVLASPLTISVPFPSILIAYATI